MIAVIQRVSMAEVRVDNKLVGSIGHGLLILLGVAKGDGAKEIRYLSEKIVNMRIFYNDDGKFDLSLKDIKGSALVVSQFTLLGNWRKGRRPGYDAAAPPDEAAPLVEKFVEALRQMDIETQTGLFGATMSVSLVNEGPVTFTLDTALVK